MGAAAGRYPGCMRAFCTGSHSRGVRERGTSLGGLLLWGAQKGYILAFLLRISLTGVRGNVGALEGAPPYGKLPLES